MGYQVYRDISNALIGKRYEDSEGREYIFLSLQEGPGGCKFCFSRDHNEKVYFSLDQVGDLEKRASGARKRMG